MRSAAVLAVAPGHRRTGGSDLRPSPSICSAIAAIPAALRRLERLAVPRRSAGPSLFFDARNLTAAWECQRLGYDPLYENPCDPWGRPLMYLRPWLLSACLGLDQSHTFARRLGPDCRDVPVVRRCWSGGCRRDRDRAGAAPRVRRR